jgi:O-antigen/teichoic acid export membrane protein
MRKIHKFLQASSWYTIGSNITNFLNYLNTIVMGRLLGPTGVGDIGAFVSYIAIFSIPISIIGTFVTQTAIKETRVNVAFSLYKKYIKHYLYASVLIVIMSYLLKDFLASVTSLSIVGSVLIIPNLWLGLIVVPLMAMTLSSERYKENVIINVISTLIKLLAIPIILATNIYSSDMSIMTMTLSMVFTSVVLYLLLSKHHHNTTPPTLRRLVEFANSKNILYTVLGSASMILLVNVDIVTARKIFDGHTAGIYATWSLLSKAIFFTLGPLLTISFVKQSKTSDQDRSLIDKSVPTIALLCIVILVPFYLIYQYAGPVMLGVVFGARFSELYPHLGLSGIFGVLTLLLNHLTNTHIAKRSWMSAITIVFAGVFVVCTLYYRPALEVYYLAIISVAASSSLGLLATIKR